MEKKIFILLGNPVKDSFSSVCADTYEVAARDGGHQVRKNEYKRYEIQSNTKRWL